MVTRKRVTDAVKAGTAARSQADAAVDDRDATRAMLVSAVNVLCQFREWRMSGLPAWVSVFDTISGVRAQGAELSANVPRLSLTGRKRQS